MADEDKGFRVIDKRGGKDQEETPQKGEGFVMKESPEKPQEQPRLPQQIDFSTFVFSLATGALINMGLAPDPQTQKTSKNLPLAKQNIDILEIIVEKTKGNLTKEEEHLVTELLSESRIRYVECNKA